MCTLGRYFLIFAVLLPVTSNAQELGVGSLKKSADEVSSKRVERKTWTNRKESDLLRKSFPLKEWNKHYSSLGSKRSPIKETEWRGRKEFKVKKLDVEVKETELSRLNERMAELHKQARISTDDKARKIAEQQIYAAYLQGSQKYEELAEELSLRDLNRFQFRRNRSDGAVPVEKAGDTSK